MHIKTLIELKHFITPLLMPPTMTALTTTTAVNTTSGYDIVAIPQDASSYLVEGTCFTSKTHVGWVGQLLQLPKKFVLHMDSKFKLHHGEWVLTTIGTHMLRWDVHHSTLSTTFVPLVYMLCKQHESLGACKMLIDALCLLASTYFGGAKLQPGACMADHCDAFRAAYRAAFPTAAFGTCWPHIIRKWREGAYCKKTWAHFDDVTEHLQSIHLAHTAEMRDMLMHEFGKLWDQWGRQMDTFWNSYCKKDGGWDVWSIGIFDCMLCTPSQQAHESWHEQIKRSKIPGMLRASTEHLFKESLPQLVMMDSIQIPSNLVFHVPAVPKKMIEKSLWYVQHSETHVHAFKNDDGEINFYVLRKDNTTGYKKISPRLIEMYEAASEGTKDRRIKDLAHLTDVCSSMHLLCPEHKDWGVPSCDLNPANLDCMHCKGFKGHGICSHVLAVNHIMKNVNLRHELMEIGQGVHKKGGGNRQKNVPALTMAPTREPDSSDEEFVRFLEQGAQGK